MRVPTSQIWILLQPGKSICKKEHKIDIKRLTLYPIM